MQVKLLSQDGELYVFAESCRPCGQGTRHAPAPAEMAVGQAQRACRDEACAQRTIDEARCRARPRSAPAGGSLNVEVATEESPFQLSGSNRKKLRQARRREGRYLLRSNLCREQIPHKLWDYYLQLVQIEEAFKNHQGRSRHPADLPSARGADRGAYLHCLPGLLPARHPRPPPEEPRAGLRMFMKVHSVFTKVHSRGTVLRARRLRLPHTPPRGAVCAGGV